MGRKVPAEETWYHFENGETVTTTNFNTYTVDGTQKVERRGTLRVKGRLSRIAVRKVDPAILRAHIEEEEDELNLPFE